MGTMTETGTEKRVDELSKRVDFGFEEMLKRVEFGFEQVDGASSRLTGGSIGSKHRSTGVSIASKPTHANCGPKCAEDSRGSTAISTDSGGHQRGFESIHQLIIRVCAGTIGSIVAGVVVLLLSHS